MSLSVFLELVEMPAKVASIMPFFLGLCFSWYNYHAVNPLLAAVFFVAMLGFNMSVDMMDNYHDYNNAIDELEYKRKTNIIGREHISPLLVRNLIIGFVTVSALLGLFLVSQVGLPLVVMGGICFFVGYFYSGGPRPFSSMPVGEVLSGVTMGFMITLISVYVNTAQTMTWNVVTVSKIFLISFPMTIWIGNLMLANNISDLDEDQRNHRYTLPHYLGRQNAVRLYVGADIIAFFAIIVAVILKIAPVATLLVLLLIPFTVKQLRIFIVKQVKRETFVTAVRILAVSATAQVVSFGIGLIF